MKRRGSNSDCFKPNSSSFCCFSLLHWTHKDQWDNSDYWKIWMIPSHYLRDSSGDKQARGSSYYSHTTPSHSRIPWSMGIIGIIWVLLMAMGPAYGLLFSVSLQKSPKTTCDFSIPWGWWWYLPPQKMQLVSGNSDSQLNVALSLAKSNPQGRSPGRIWLNGT